MDGRTLPAVTGVRVVRPLGEPDRPAVEALITRDPVAHCVVHSRVVAAARLTPFELGGRLWGVDGPGGVLRAACFAAGNLMPVGGGADEIDSLAAELASHRRTWSSIVGPAPAVFRLLDGAGHAWGEVRAIRANQPVLVTTTRPRTPPDPLVAQVTPRQLTRYLPAALAMFSEELELQAPPAGIHSPYRARLTALIAAGLAFARFDEQGRVVFKAEIAAVSPLCCQIQGVWVDPALRGRGIGAAGVAAVIEHGLTLAPVVSLYVNDYNTPARRMYARLGFRQVNTFATVLY
jgi:uncharacterized protein